MFPVTFSVAAVIIIIVTLVMATVAMVVDTALCSLCRFRLVLSRKAVDEPPAEHCREERRDGAYYGERKSHQRVCGGDGVNARLRRRDQETGACPMRRALTAQEHSGSGMPSAAAFTTLLMFRGARCLR